MAKKTNRECQPCTACCDGWVTMKIGDAEVYPSQACPHSTKNGCGDYDNRPVDPCHRFNCAWVVEDSVLPEWMKPSNSKAIVILNKLQWRGIPVDLAVPVGKRIPPRTLKWLQNFVKTQSRLLIYTEQVIKNGKFQKDQNIIAYGTDAFQQDVYHSQQAGIDLWK